MTERLPIADFLKRSDGIPLLDVRAPSEFQSGHIPGATGFPLFTDVERAEIGTLYKQKGRQAAVVRGLEITGPKMAIFAGNALALNAPAVAMYCWRGGMRSDSMAWLLDRIGLDVTLLEGGYKAWRGALVQFFESPLPLKVLTGYTGSMKTLLLARLRNCGAQVIDLEGLANHTGSSFGNKLCPGQPTTEHFQNLLFEDFRQLDITRTIWIEDENMRVGAVNMPEALYRQLALAPRVLIEAPRNRRIAYLTEEYGKIDREKLAEATQAIRKKLGFDKAELAIGHIADGNLEAAASIILDYYDARYQRGMDARRHLVLKNYETDLGDLDALARQLIKDDEHGY